jgi:hypothetical protein
MPFQYLVGSELPPFWTEPMPCAPIKDISYIKGCLFLL